MIIKAKKYTYIQFNKPYGVLCQFTDEAGRPTLKDFIPIKGIYPVGRLDLDSEGLLLLTDDGQLNQQLTNPKNKQYKTYLAQVEGLLAQEAIESLARGVVINKVKSLPAKVKLLSQEPKLWERPVKIRYRKYIPTSWIEISIQEGMNRQVRKMTAATGFPCLRLVRIAIGPLKLGALQPGSFSYMEKPSDKILCGNSSK